MHYRSRTFNLGLDSGVTDCLKEFIYSLTVTTA